MNTPTPTPITDDLSETFDYRGLPCLKKSVELSRALELKLTAAREEITLLETNLKIQTKHTENAVQDRADEHIELHNQIHEVTEQRDAAREEINTLKTMCISNANEANDLRQQRDRLAEALEEITMYGDPMSDQIATEALQSLNQDHTVDANDMIAAVKGVADE
jgi:uncharacterized coiled-coil DUF342 family protein